MTLKYDDATRKWFEDNAGAQTTVIRCGKCGLFFMPRLGHRCAEKPETGGEEREMIAICREVDKNSGAIAVYPLKAEVTSELVYKLGIRQRLNPELRYFIVGRQTWGKKFFAETLMQILGQRELTDKDVEKIGVIRVE